jgi:Co/Zn/Cd efflux system component
MNSWTLIASIASILSLFFHLSGKGSSLRQFTLPATTALVGYAIGRNRLEVEQTVNSFLQDPHLLFMLAIAVLLFALTLYLVESTKPDAKVSLIFLIFLVTIAVPKLIESYYEIAPMVATPDYLTLARIKETDGNTEDAIKYLKIYSKRVHGTEIHKQLGQRIDSLRKQQFDRDSNAQLKLKDN